MVGEQFIVPVLLAGELSGDGDVPLPQQFAGDPAGSLVASLVIVQAQGDFLYLGLGFQQVVDGGCAHPAQGHIAVILPPLRVERNIGQHIYRGLKGVELSAGTWPVEAVLLLAAGERLAEMGACQRPPGVEVANLALLIPAHKHGVVVVGTLVEEVFPGEGGHHLRGDAPGLAQVSEHPPHIFMGGWDFQLFRFFLSWTGGYRRRTCGELLQIRHGAVQQHSCRLFFRFPVEVVEEIHGVPAFLGVLVEPDVIADSDPLVVEFPLPLAAQLLQRFPTGAEQGYQVGAACQVALFLGDRYPSLHFKFLPVGLLFLGDLLPQLFVHQPGHGRVDLKLLSKNLPHLPQEPGSHGQEGRGVVLVLRLSLLHVQLHRRPYHCVADGLEVRVFREGYPL